MDKVPYSTYLQNSLGQPRLLRQLLEVLGVRVLVEVEIGLHGSELVVLEGGPHALGAVLSRGLVVVAVTLHLKFPARHQLWRQGGG